LSNSPAHDAVRYASQTGHAHHHGGRTRASVSSAASATVHAADAKKTAATTTCGCSEPARASRNAASAAMDADEDLKEEARACLVTVGARALSYALLVCAPVSPKEAIYTTYWGCGTDVSCYGLGLVCACRICLCTVFAALRTTSPRLLL
jgi:hypothetical protein